jgi:hypothetical protein
MGNVFYPQSKMCIADVSMKWNLTKDGFEIITYSFYASNVLPSGGQFLIISAVPSGAATMQIV